MGIKEWLYVIIFAVLLTASRVGSQCVSPSPLGLQLAVEYARWRSLDQLVIFDNLNPKKCQRTYARSFLSCCGDKGIKISIQTSLSENLPDILPEAFSIRSHRVGTIIFIDGLNITSPDNILQLASQKQLFNYYISWLLVTTKRTDAIIDRFLRILNIGIDSDVVVATSPMSTSQATNATFQYMNRTCKELHGYASSYKVFRIQGSRKSNENQTRNLEYSLQDNKTVSFRLCHVYKIRNSENSSLVVDDLGSWNPGSYTLKFPISVELRNNFHGFPLVVGILNSSSELQTESVDEEEVSDIIPLLDIVAFVVNWINASTEFLPHEKLGTLANKAWSHLLGDVVSGAVDIGLGNINVNDERQRGMSFTHPIIQSMRNIYFHPPESGSMRDIFLQPFNNRLLGCVAATWILIVTAISAINYAGRLALCNKTETDIGFGEAGLCCIGIMCMQGSPWYPKSLSGKITLLMSLIFALVIYNAYAGFITSILSVQAAGIKSLTDLLFNNYKLGYSGNDDEYIRNANDSNLRQLYIKAFNGREARLDTTSGLQKAARGGYGFFVSARLARRALRTTLLHNRCSLKELVIPQTISFVALPMAHTCPYKKIINYSILRIREVGVLSRISERMLPKMPQCEALTTFHSARLADVYSAFVILVTGIISALTLGILERLWSQRKSVRSRLKRAVRAHRRDVPPATTSKKYDVFSVAAAAVAAENYLEEENDSDFRSGRISPTTTTDGPGQFDIDHRRSSDRGDLLLSSLRKPTNFSGLKLFSPRRRRHVDINPRDDGDVRRDERNVFPFHD